MDNREQIEAYKAGLQTLVDYLTAYSLSELTGPGLKAPLRILTTAASKKYPKMEYDGLLEVMRQVDEVLDEIYEGESYPPLMVFEDEDLTVRTEADRLSRIMVGLGVESIFEKYDAERHRKQFRKSSTVADKQKRFLKNLKVIAEILNKPVHSEVFHAVATDMYTVVRDVQQLAFSRSEDPFTTHMLHCYGTPNMHVRADAAARSLNYTRKLGEYQMFVTELLRLGGVEARTGRALTPDLKTYNLWLEDELVNLEELYLCITYQRILNVL